MVKPGYKQTELGIIPEDWILMPSGEFIEVLTDFTANGSFASLAENVTYLDYPDYARLVRLTDIRTNFKNQGIYVSKASYEFLAKSSLFGGELLLANVGAYAGYSFLFQKNFQEYATLGPNMFLIKANKNILREEYVPLVFGYGSVFKQLIDAAASSAQPKINKDNVRKSVAIIPPLDEQKRIAEALSDVDSMISSLEKLIAKKKAVKQGAMQELLTGKKRLPGFTGEWHHEPFGKLCTICRGGSPRPIQDYLTTSDSGINWIKIGDVKPNAKYITSTQEKIVESGVSMSRRVYKGDFILSNSMSFGRPYILKLDGCIHDGWLAIQDYQVAFDTDFLYYVLGSNYVFEQYIQMAAGSSVQNLNKEKVAQLKLYIPALEEQTAIASILSDMDNEIEALEQKLEKARHIKQGMMQQLLTGKIRLV